MLNISVSGYQHWKAKQPSAQEIRRERLKQHILELYVEHNGIAGSPIITADFNDVLEFQT